MVVEERGMTRRVFRTFNFWLNDSTAFRQVPTSSIHFLAGPAPPQSSDENLGWLCSQRGRSSLAKIRSLSHTAKALSGSLPAPGAVFATPFDDHLFCTNGSLDSLRTTRHGKSVIGWASFCQAISFVERVCTIRIRAFLHQRFGVYRGDTADALLHEQSREFREQISR